MLNRDWTTLFTIASSFCLTFAVVSGGKVRAAEKSVQDLSAAQSCFSFVWAHTHGDRHSRAGIMVPVEINDQRGYMQLDTGAPQTVLYGAVTDRSGLTDPARDTLLPRKFCAGSYCWTPSPLKIDRRKPASNPKIIGHLGLDILQSHETLIDYPSRHICALAGDERNLKVTWSPAVVSAVSFFISGTIGATHLDRLLFDTGFGPFTVSVFPATWDALPSLPEPATPPMPIEGHSYDGTQVHVQGKLVAGTVTLGPTTLTQPLVYEMPENLQPIVAQRGATGVVGDAPFLDQQIILDMRKPARFGVINSTQPVSK